MTDFSKLKKIFRSSLIRNLIAISSSERTLEYQNKVPFVVMSYELFAQWNTTNSAKGQKWFSEEFTQNNRELFGEFNILFTGYMHTTDKATLMDVKLLLQDPRWQQIQVAAADLVEKISNNVSSV